jgi:S-DNA-T family DNA segregation ATPase FtsK/SpoIIIE
MITNLQSDLRLVDRMHDALFGEQERRQQLLRDAGNVDDAIAYRRLRERRPDLAPLPDLLVVIDEFGELLAARPEYLDLFVAIGRVGRSLGIHLLFSSQRFDEGRLRGLESHLRYRVCLRTFSAAESKGVIDTPDAYLLPSEPGLGYLKVDTTVYERFRATMVSEPSSAGGGSDPRRALVVPFATGAGVPAASAAGGSAAERANGDLRRIAHRLRDAHTGPVHQVWCAPLPAALALDELTAVAFWERGTPASGLHATVGVVDLPKEQRTRPLRLDFSGTAGHGAVVGGPQSGKSTLLRTLVLGLAREHTPEEVQVYAIDLGGGLLRALADLPHVAAVAGKADRELVLRIVARAKAEIAEREEAFRRLSLDSMADVHARRAAGLEAPCGDLFLLIDGWANLRRDFEDLDYEIEELLASGLTYGVHVVIAAGRWGEMRPSVSDALGTRLELRISDPLDSEIDRKAAGRLPADAPGRGLIQGGLEFQIALPRLDGRGATDDLGSAIAAAAGEIAGRWGGPPARPVQVLPRRLYRDELGLLDGPGVAIGIEEDRLETVGVDLRGTDPHMLVLGDGESGRTNALRALVEGLAGADDPAACAITIFDPRRTLGDLAGLAHVRSYATTQTQMLMTADALVDELQARSDDVDAGRPRTGPAHVVVVDDYDLLAGSENPLKGLTGAIAHGRDLDFHVVIARRVAGLSRASFEPFFQALLELRTQGLVLSGDRGEGPVLDGYRASEQPPGRGLLVRRGRAVVVQTVLAPARAEAEPLHGISARSLVTEGGPL